MCPGMWKTWLWAHSVWSIVSGGFLRALLWGMVGSEGGMVGCEEYGEVDALLCGPCLLGGTVCPWNSTEHCRTRCSSAHHPRPS